VNDKDKTRKQLLEELTQTRQQIAELEASETKRGQAKDAVQWSGMWLPIVILFSMLYVLIWLNEVLDFPHLFLGASRTPVNWQEAIIEAILIIIVGLLTVSRLVRDIAKRKRAEKDLKEYRDHLEELVGERTAELTTANEQLQQEVTERKQAEEALRQRNRELALLNRASQALSSTLDLDQVPVAVLDEVRHLLGVIASSVWLTDPETGELVCQQATGLQSEITRGWRLRPGEGLVGWVARSGESLIVPDTRADERHFKDVDKQTGLEMRSILSVPLQARQNVIGVLQVADAEVDRFSPTDLTLLEPLAASAAIAIDNARLVEALRQGTVELQARNEDLAAFGHTAAHDLKNPLARIVGFSEVLKEEYATMPGEELRRHLHKMAQTGRKMSSIIDELLLLAGVRQMEVEMRPLDMGSIVAEVQQRMAHMIEEYQAEIILSDTWPVTMGYGPWVEEVWINYLSNALKYGGRPPHVEIGAKVQPDGMVRFWIRDNGQGIPPDARDRLFTPFTRLDQVSAEGHGLGLSIVQRIVKRFGGEVDVESKAGQGSVFSFTLPGVASQTNATPGPHAR
jgi:signal transduction histidine kinase